MYSLAAHRSPREMDAPGEAMPQHLTSSCVRSIGSRLCRQEACAGAARAVEELGEYERSAVESIEAALGVLTSSEERTDANL